MPGIIKPIDKNRESKLEAFDRLLTIMDELRENCPWDMKQTFESLRSLTIEEMYELSDAVLDGNMEEIKGELGDLMLHMVFYAKIGSEKKEFDMTDILNTICDKLIRRHPHIYGEVKVNDEEDVKKNWERIKLSEKENLRKEAKINGVLSGVPVSLPSLVKAIRIQEKARGAGFDWEKREQVWDKVKEEMEEFHNEFDSDEKDEAKKENVTAEFGDLLFSLVNYARFISIDPEEALERTNKKFIKRFQYMENESMKDGKKLTEMTLEEMDRYWNKAKQLK